MGSESIFLSCIFLFPQKTRFSGEICCSSMSNFQISNMKAILILLTVMLVNAGKPNKPPKVPSDLGDRVCYYCVLANGPQCLFPCQPYGKPYVNPKSCFQCLAVNAPECLHPCGNLSTSVSILIYSI